MKKKPKFKKNDVVMLVNLDEKQEHREYWSWCCQHMNFNLGIVESVDDNGDVNVSHQGQYSTSYVGLHSFIEPPSELVKIGVL